MKVFTWLIIASICSISCQSRLDKTEASIRRELAGLKGTFAVAFEDLSTGDQILINEKEVFHAASTMKTPVMIEIYKQARECRFKLSDSIAVKNEFKSIVDGSPYRLDLGDDSETELYAKVGTQSTIYDLTYEMIIVSSNLATNILIELVDPRKVNQSMRDLGAADIQVLRGVEDSKAYQQGLSNTTTAYDLMVIMKAIANGKVVSPEACVEMTQILLDQQFNEIIPAKLPADVKVAHKTGSITGVNHDSGFIILPDGRKYVLVVLSKEVEDKDAAIAAMANISRIIYEAVSD